MILVFSSILIKIFFILLINILLHYGIYFYHIILIFLNSEILNFFLIFILTIICIRFINIINIINLIIINVIIKIKRINIFIITNIII